MNTQTKTTNAAADDLYRPRADESEFISAVRFLMIAGLTVHHLFDIPGSAFYPREPLAQYTHLLPDLINGFVHMTFVSAVPLLSVISGFLFFRRAKIDFVALLKKRFFSVALPSWTWALIWVAGLVVAHRITQGAVSPDQVRDLYDNFTPLAFANAVVGVTQAPVAYQFWFVHDLILTLLLSPVIYLLLRVLGLVLLPILFAVWFTGFVPPMFFSFNVVVFFCVGAYLGTPRGPRLSTVLQKVYAWRWLVLPVFVAAIFGQLFSHELGALEPYITDFRYVLLLRVFGVLAFSQLMYGVVLRGGFLKNLLIRYSGYSFFVFAAHFPTIGMLSTIAERLPGTDSAIAFFLMWLLIPALTISACIFAAVILERLMPRVFRLLNGGRGAAPSRPRPPEAAPAAQLAHPRPVTHG